MFPGMKGLSLTSRQNNVFSWALKMMSLVRLRDPKEKKIVKSRDVIFFEDQTIEYFDQKKKTESTIFIPSNLNPRPTLQLHLMPVNHGEDLKNDDNGGFLIEPLVSDPESTNDDIDVIPKQVFKKLQMSHN
jgi:hypothetical protein